MNLLLDGILKIQEEAKEKLERKYGPLLFKAADLFLFQHREEMLKCARAFPFNMGYSSRAYNEEVEDLTPGEIQVMKDTIKFYDLLSEYRGVFGREEYYHCGFTFSALNVGDGGYVTVKWRKAE